VNDPNASATGSPFFLPEKKHQPTARHTIMQIQNVQMENKDFLIEVVDMQFGRSAEHMLDFFFLDSLSCRIFFLYVSSTNWSINIF